MANKHRLVEDPISVVDITIEYIYDHGWKDYKQFAKLLTREIIAKKPLSTESFAKLVEQLNHPFFAFNQVTKRSFARDFPIANLLREGSSPRPTAPPNRSRNTRRPISKKLRLLVLERDGFRCQLCGKTARETKLEVDHKIPAAKGGTDSLNNLWTLCFDCNRGKSDLSLQV